MEPMARDECMARFSAMLMDHFQEPRNQRPLSSADVVGTSGVPGQGRFLSLYLRLSEGRVALATFECHGCGVTIACGSILTELVEGRTLEECAALTAKDLIAALDGIPADKQDRAGFALIALQTALSQTRQIAG